MLNIIYDISHLVFIYIKDEASLGKMKVHSER